MLFFRQFFPPLHATLHRKYAGVLRQVKSRKGKKGKKKHSAFHHVLATPHKEIFPMMKHSSDWKLALVRMYCTTLFFFSEFQ